MRTRKIFIVEGSHAGLPERPTQSRPDPLAALLPAGNPRYLKGPWSAEDLRCIEATDRVLVLGAGLEAIDAVLELDEQGHRAPIRLVSSHGLVPRTQQLVAPAAAARLAALLEAGRLELSAGRVRGAAAYGDTFVVDVLPRGRTLHSSERYDWIVNATGADFPRYVRGAARTAHLSPP